MRKPATRIAVPKPLKGKLVRIGNSRGVRLPKAVIEQAGLTENVRITVEGDQVIIRSKPDRNPRADWDEQMKKAIAEHGNELSAEDREWLDAPLNPEFDAKEWTW